MYALYTCMKVQQYWVHLLDKGIPTSEPDHQIVSYSGLSSPVWYICMYLIFIKHYTCVCSQSQSHWPKAIEVNTRYAHRLTFSVLKAALVAT